MGVKQNNVLPCSGLHLFNEKTLHCKITWVDIAKYAESQGCTLYHCDINYPVPLIQQFSVYLCKPGIHPD